MDCTWRDGGGRAVAFVAAVGIWDLSSKKVPFRASNLLYPEVSTAGRIGGALEGGAFDASGGGAFVGEACG